MEKRILESVLLKALGDLLLFAKFGTKLCMVGSNKKDEPDCARIVTDYRLSVKRALLELIGCYLFQRRFLFWFRVEL